MQNTRQGHVLPVLTSTGKLAYMHAGARGRAVAGEQQASRAGKNHQGMTGEQASQASKPHRSAIRALGVRVAGASASTAATASGSACSMGAACALASVRTGSIACAHDGGECTRHNKGASRPSAGDRKAGDAHKLLQQQARGPWQGAAPTCASSSDCSLLLLLMLLPGGAATAALQCNTDRQK